VRDQRLHGGWIDSSRVAFFGQCEVFIVRISSMASRGLQNAQPHFDAVVSRKTLSNAQGDQEFGLTQLLNNFGLHVKHPSVTNVI
jgi:hypothetical protein